MDPVEAIYFKGLIHAKKQSYPYSLQLFQQVIEAKPNHIKAHYMKGMVMLYQNNLDEAEGELLHVIELNKTFYRAYAGLGKIYMQKKDYAKALQYFNATSKLKPSYSEIYFDVGIAYLALGNYNKALKYFSNASFTKMDLHSYKKMVEELDNYEFDDNLKDFFIGFLYFKRGFYRLAQFRFIDFLKYVRDDNVKWKNLGKMYLSLCQIGTYHEIDK